ncbi:MAG: c-type cytochrome [Arcobacteraceae bacterium]
MIKLFFLFLTTLLCAKTDFNNSFITKFEYGKMLYANPRGISCAKCHGDDAKGKKIASFTHIRNKVKYNCTIRSEDITNISYKNFIATLDPRLEKPKKKFAKDQICEKLIYGNSMPKYFLTNEELNSIYFYLTNKEKYK